jgi:hypothetical protein
MLRNGVSAAAWKPDVENDGVKVLRVHKLLALLGRGGRNDCMPVLPQTRAQQFHHARIVFNDKNAQICSRFHCMLRGINFSH